jgi:uncharacterized protein (TIGR02444 family)
MTAAPVVMDSPLWQFSLAVYRGAGVQDECLDVQERLGIDVNLLMFCAYVGAAEGAVLSDQHMGDALEVVGAWHADVVRTLRQVRRMLKPWGAAGQGGFSPVAEALRVKVKGAELEAEHIEQAMMWAWLRARAATLRRQDPRAALAANVRALLMRCGADAADSDPLSALPHLCAAALQVAARDRPTGTHA